MDNIVLFLIFLVSLVVIDFIYFKWINKFQIKWFMHIISILVPLVCVIIFKEYTPKFLIFCLTLEVLMILGFKDIMYYEVERDSYWILFLLAFIKILFFTTHIFEACLSPIVIYICFWVFDKIIGIEKLGGADVKIILIMSFYYCALDVFSFILYTFLVCTLLFIGYMIKQRTFKQVKVPMIVGIATSFFLNEIILLSTTTYNFL